VLNGMPSIFRPHDLLWICRSALKKPELDAGSIPAWVSRGKGPVVVRRAETQPGLVPVGIRGSKREERFAALAPEQAVEKSVSPFALRAAKLWLQHPERDHHPVLRTLGSVACILNEEELDWGITGSLGYELATGDPQLRPGSDLDLVIERPTPMSRHQAEKLMTKLTGHLCRIDVQVETPEGAIGLSEWARPSGKVLIKTSMGPRLTESPWSAPHEGGGTHC